MPARTTDPPPNPGAEVIRAAGSDESPTRSMSGLDRLVPGDLPGRRVVLLSHYAAMDRRCRSAARVLYDMPGVELKALMGPQHGFWGQTQDNMIEWTTHTHPEWGIPVHSLYGESREPSPEMLSGCDCVVVDLQDAGSRYYTYVYAMALTMRCAASCGIPVVVLDRFNPVGLRVVEGPPQDGDMLSYVGMYRIPVRHAMTTGELARHFAALDGLPEPAVVEFRTDCMDGFPDDYPWMHPSPNLPTPATALVYPGMCLLEATNLSEGRGTCRPFEIFGAPWLDEERLCDSLAGSPPLAGASLSPHRFIPTFHKHAGETCRGAVITVTDREAFRPFAAGLAILAECFRHPETGWRPPPYEYVFDRMPVDILAGSPRFRAAVEAGDTDELAVLARADAAGHRAAAGSSLLYDRDFEE